MSQPIRVLVVEQDPAVSQQIQAAFTAAGAHCLAVADPQQAIAAIASACPGVVVTEIDLPGTTGFAVLSEALVRDPACRVILVSAAFSASHLARALSMGAYDYFPQPLDAAALVATALEPAQGSPSPRLPLRAAQALEDAAPLRHASLESVRALVRAVEAKDRYTLSHSEHVVHYATHLARHVGLSAGDVDVIAIAASLHDLGMIGVNDRTLAKEGPLTEEEFESVRRHPNLGAHILEQIGIFSAEAALVRHHHERWDGLGYPDGLRGEEIPLGSRILLLADSIDAMLMPRSYKQAYPVGKMLDELSRCAGRQFDPSLSLKAIQWCLMHPGDIILYRPAALVGAW